MNDGILECWNIGSKPNAGHDENDGKLEKALDAGESGVDLVVPGFCNSGWDMD